MKKISLLLLLVAAILFPQNSWAQKAKFGHIDYAATIQQMDGIDTVQTVVAKFKADLEAEAATMNEEFQNKYNDFAAKQATYSPSVAQIKQKELESLYERIQTFTSSAESDLQLKQIEMLKPFQEKLIEAIKIVAKENGYTYIFDKNTVLYYSDSEDITNKVKAKLGIK